MEENLTEKSIFVDIPNEKVYNERAIWVGSFLGGPIIAGYFIAENFKVFKEYEKVRNTWIISIISTIFIFGGIFLIPENISIPNHIIPLIYTGIAYFIAKHFQEKKINEHKENGGKYFSWWRTIGISILGILLFAVVGVVFFIFWDLTSN